MFILQISVQDSAKGSGVVSPWVTPVALIGRNLRTKGEIENLAGEINPHPALMQPLLSIIGELFVGEV